MKRFISALVALAMILSMVPAVFATESGSSLTLGENKLSLSVWDFGKEDFDSWSYTASEAGTLTLSVTGIATYNYYTDEMDEQDPGNFEAALEGYFLFEVTKNGNTLSGDSLVTNTVEVVEGDVITVSMTNGTYMPAEITVNLSLAGAEAPAPSEPTPAPSGLVLGDNHVSLAAGDFDGDSWTFVATEAGGLTVTVTALTLPSYNENDELVMTPVDAAYLDMVLGMQYQLTLTKNGEAVDGTCVNVAVGDVVTVTLVSKQFNQTEATLTLTLGTH